MHHLVSVAVAVKYPLCDYHDVRKKVLKRFTNCLPSSGWTKKHEKAVEDTDEETPDISDLIDGYNPEELPNMSESDAI